MKQFIPTRWSHLIGYSGVGALVRADNDLFVVKDINHWTDKEGRVVGEPLRYVDLLRSTLGLDEKEIRNPPLARLLPKGAVDGTCVPARRFPGWTRCPRCGLLHYLPWRAGEAEGEGATGDPRCGCDEATRLRQVDWVLAHPDGGLAEVPWHFLAHREPGRRDCRWEAQQPHLRMQCEASTGRWLIKCTRCKTTAPFNPREPLTLKMDPARQPWQQGGTASNVPSKQPFVILEVNDLRLYLPRIASGLVIPPESRVPRGSVLDRLYCNPSARKDLEHCRTDLAYRGLLRRLADQFGCDRTALEDAWREIKRGWPLYGETATRGQMVEKEYQALITPIPGQLEGEDFVSDHLTESWRGLALEDAQGSPTRAIRHAVQQLVAITRLREIRIFLGFSRVGQSFDDRIRPNTPGDPGEPTGRLVPPDLDGSQPWLPAIELYGEGIFFTLNEALLRRWEQQDGLAQRAKSMQQRWEETGIRLVEEPPSPITSRFLLLHTLAHLLIRRLEAEAGYPAASIRERIYCAGGTTPMAGILVYVAVPDVAGSLGGIAELAQPKRFMRLLASVFDHAAWCSLDPVCTEHEGQGPSQLNRAACHACALVPEPSCQYGNLLLDRVFVAGDQGGTIQSVLDFAGEG